LTTWLLARFSTLLDPKILRWMFSGFITMLALRMLLARHRTVPLRDEARPPMTALPLVGAMGGSCMGLLGIGGGLVATPVLSGWLGLRQAMAQSLSLALVAPSSIIALTTYAGAGQVDWKMGLPLAAGGLLTVASGVTLAHRLPERRMRTFFAWMLLVTAIWLVISPLLK